MGVKTKVFGRFAWLMFEGIGRYYDEYMLHATKEDQMKMMDYMREFFALIGFVLPCVYCRISYRQFVNSDIHVPKFLMQKDGGKKLVYALHNRVTKKLWDQDREAAENDRQKLQEVNEKWRKYSISYEEALKTRFPSIQSHRFWNATIVFLALIMCDYREEDACHIYRFFWVLGKMLCLQSTATSGAYATGLEASLPIWKAKDMSTNLSTRIDIVWILKNHVFDTNHWTFGSTRTEFEDKCRAAIVGCGTSKKV